MPKESMSQRKTVGRVMHEWKHGELKRGRGGRGGRVKTARQAVAIALREAGASRSAGKAENRRSLRRSKSKERRGETAQQEREGRGRIGARSRRSSSRAMGGANARRRTHRTRRQTEAARRNVRKAQRAVMRKRT
jgi:hypothetical protein